MKRIYLLATVLLILIAILSVNLYFLNNKVVAPGLSVNQHGTCAKEGEYVGGSAVGGKAECCSGLKAMTGFEYNGGCSNLMAPGSGVICSAKCGNGKCESWENKCSCPKDCKNMKNAFLTPKNDNELRACTKDDDCVLTDAKSCCGCFDIINKKFSSYWNQLEKGICPEGIACEACQYYKDSPNVKAICLAGQCASKGI